MLRLLFIEYFSRALSKATAIAAAIAKLFRTLDSTLQAKTAAHALIVSDVFGADAYRAHRPGVTGKAGVPDQVCKTCAWDTALDFSPPPSLQTAEDWPRILSLPVSKPVSIPVAAATGIAAVDSGSFDSLLAAIESDAVWDAMDRARVEMHAAMRFIQRSARARAPALLMAAVVVLLWIGSGQSNPLPQRRNPDADAVADRFSRSGPPDRPPVTAPGITAFGTTEDADIVGARFDFAPRLGGLYQDDGIVTGSTPDAATPPGDGAAISNEDQLNPDAAVPAAAPVSSDAGLIMIRNLPVGTLLSAGKRVTRTDWALTRNDLANVIVTLPPARRAPIKASIEVYSMAGLQTGTMAVEIREQRSQQASGPHKARIYRPAGERPPRSAAMKKRVASVNATVPNVNDSPSVKQPAGEHTPAPAAPAKTSLFPQLPFLPSSQGSGTLQNSDSVGKQILINLGVLPAAPVAGLAPKQ
jgi:hypothetical protein